jgi:hypothetical protein
MSFRETETVFIAQSLETSLHLLDRVNHSSVQNEQKLISRAYMEHSPPEVTEFQLTFSASMAWSCNAGDRGEFFEVLGNGGGRADLSEILPHFSPPGLCRDPRLPQGRWRKGEAWFPLPSDSIPCTPCLL